MERKQCFCQDFLKIKLILYCSILCRSNHQNRKIEKSKDIQKYGITENKPKTGQSIYGHAK
uniref:Uncharacterized protein n=1 Tax=Rhizophora mucronata TaxID=61149 RepID=A0A2P2N3M1_RHIMU